MIKTRKIAISSRSRYWYDKIKSMKLPAFKCHEDVHFFVNFISFHFYHDVALYHLIYMEYLDKISRRNQSTWLCRTCYLHVLYIIITRITGWWLRVPSWDKITLFNIVTMVTRCRTLITIRLSDNVHFVVGLLDA